MYRKENNVATPLELLQQHPTELGAYVEALSPNEQTHLLCCKVSLRETVIGELADQVARDALERCTSRLAMDLNCSIGGQTMGLARQGFVVTAVDRCAKRLDMARQNAAFFCPGAQIKFTENDYLHAIEELAKPWGLIVLDPPWGFGHHDVPEFGFQNFQDDVAAQIKATRRHAELVALKLPRNFAVGQLDRIGEYEVISYETERYHRKPMFLMAYFKGS